MKIKINLEIEKFMERDADSIKKKKPKTKRKELSEIQQLMQDARKYSPLKLYKAPKNKKIRI